MALQWYAFIFPLLSQNLAQISQGMATRLAFDLALHLDMSAYVSSGVITAADADLRRAVFWSAYTVDKYIPYPWL
jgi:ABC-type polysaccharide/polyol phosphate transport system ATPase subunit